MSRNMHVRILSALCLVALLAPFASQAQTSNPSTLPRFIRFAGVARDPDGKALPGAVGITFALYAEQTGGAALWMETQNVQTDPSGHYSVLLGSTKPDGLPGEIFAAEQARWIGVQIERQSEQPRTLLVSAPYALKAGDAETLGGLPPSAFVQVNPAGPAVKSAPSPVAGGAASAAARTNVTATTAKSVTTTGGTVGRIPVFTTATNIQNSVITQKGPDIGVGTTTPTHVLEVNAGKAGAAQLALISTGPDAAISVKNTATGGLEYWIDSGSGSAFGAGNFAILDRTHGAARFIIDPSGHVGIGTIHPHSQLEVDSKSTTYAGLTATGGNSPNGAGQTGSTGLTANGGSGDLSVDASSNGGAGLVANGGESTSIPGTGVIANGGFGQMTGEGGSGLIATGQGEPNGDGSGGFFVGGNFGGFGDGLDASAGSGLAGNFTGNVSVSGSLSKGGGSFKIDHPLDPANKYLYHSFVESPDMKNIYDGVATLDENGEAVIRMPEWFSALNRDFRYQLTCIGAFAPVFVAEELAKNQFKIGGGRARMRVSWQVTGIRQDAWANANRIPVEELKNNRERGYYLHPELYGAPAERQVEWARHPRMMKKLQLQKQPMNARAEHPVVAAKP
jgi:trimeric autotransporter adhesin